jgi:hypothetical protein
MGVVGAEFVHMTRWARRGPLSPEPWLLRAGVEETMFWWPAKSARSGVQRSVFRKSGPRLAQRIVIELRGGTLGW